MMLAFIFKFVILHFIETAVLWCLGSSMDVVITFQRISRDDSVLLSILCLWKGVPNLLSVLKRNWFVQVFQLACRGVFSFELYNLEDWIHLLDDIDRYVTDVRVVQIDVWVFLLASTTQFFWLYLYVMGPLAVLE